MNRKQYRVEVQFPFDVYTFIALSDIVELAADKKSDGSGAGFGWRDMSFYCKSFKSAKEMSSRIAEKLNTIRKLEAFMVNIVCERRDDA